MDLTNYYELRNSADEINVPDNILGEEGEYSKQVRKIYREQGSINSWRFISFQADFFVGFVNKNNEVRYFTCELEHVSRTNIYFYCYFENDDSHFLVVNAREAINGGLSLVHELNGYFA